MKRSASVASLGSAGSRAGGPRRQRQWALPAPAERRAVKFRSPYPALPAPPPPPPVDNSRALVPVGSRAVATRPDMTVARSEAVRLPEPSVAELVASHTRPIAPELTTPDDGTRWVGAVPMPRGVRKRPIDARTIATARAILNQEPFDGLPEDLEPAAKRIRQMLLDYGNPTPSQVPLTEQMALVPVGSRALKRARDPDDMQLVPAPTLQIMAAKRQRLNEPGAVVVHVPTGQKGGRTIPVSIKRRRLNRRQAKARSGGTVADVEMVDVSVPSASAESQRAAEKVVRSLASGRTRIPRRSKSTAMAKRRRGVRRRRRGAAAPGIRGRRRLNLNLPRGVRYHPSMRLPAGWEAGPYATRAAAIRATLPVVRYHPSIARSLA